MKRREILLSLLAAATAMTLTAPAGAQALDKFPFRLNWTLYGEHAPFFVALDKGFYKEEGLDVEILEGSGSTTVAQLVANATNPVAYVDAATMMRGVGAGMPIKAVGVTLQQSPMSFIYRADNPRPTKISEIKGSRIAITAGDASLAIFTAFMGKLGMKVSDVQLITVANPAAKEQAVLAKQADALLGYFMDQGPRMQLQTGVKMGWTRLYDMAGISTLSSAIIVNNDWLKDAKNQDQLKRFLRGVATRLGIHRQHRDEAAAIFIKHAPAFNKEIALLEINGTMTIIHTKHTEGKPLFWSAKEDWQESQDLLEKFAKMPPQADMGKYYTNEYLAQPPYTAGKSSPRRSSRARRESACVSRKFGTGRRHERAIHPADQCRQDLSDQQRRRRSLPRHQSGYPAVRIRRHRRPERLRQDHHPEDGGRAGALHLGHHHGRRQARRPPADRRRHRVPGSHHARLARRAGERDAANRHPQDGPRQIRADRAQPAEGHRARRLREEEALRAFRRHAAARSRSAARWCMARPC